MIEFIVGRSGTGKTHYMINEIKRLVEKKESGKIFLVVPDQMSFQTEYQLLNILEKHVMMQVEIVGLSRFVARLIEELSPIAYTSFEQLGQQMLFQYVASNLSEELQVYQDSVNRVEFITYLQQFYRQSKGSQVDLKTVLDELDAPNHLLLHNKLSDIEKIVTHYEANIHSDTLDTSNRMDYLMKIIDDSRCQSVLGNYHVFIDGYHMFNEQEFQILAHVLPLVQHGSISFATDGKKNAPTSIFSTVDQQLNKFQSIFPHARKKVLTNNTYRFQENNVLATMERHYEQPQNLVAFCGPLDETLVSVDVYNNKSDEVNYVAKQIRKLLESGVKAKEIAVYVPNKESYELLISSEFTSHEIPFYLDLKTPMLYHPFFQCLRLLASIVIDNWQFEDVLALSQNEYFKFKYGIQPQAYFLFLEQADQLAIRYPSIWKQEKYWKYFNTPEKLEDSFDEEKTEMVNNIRLALLEEVAVFSSALQGTLNREAIESLYQYIAAQDYAGFIQTLEDELPSFSNHLTETQYHEMAWNGIITILEQLYASLGHLPFTKDNLLQAFVLGLDNAEFASIPLGFDTVLIGDYERSRFQTVHQDGQEQQMGMKYAFILGLIEGTMPHAEDSNAVMSEQELLVLQEMSEFSDVLLGKQAILYQLFRFYSLVTASSYSIHLSYYQIDGVKDDTIYGPAHVLSTFMSDGFNIPIRDFSDQNIQEQFLFYQPEASFFKEFSMNYPVEKKRHSLMYQYVQAANFATILKLQELAAYKNNVRLDVPVNLPSIFSMTQFETYNTCSYKYFLQYILNISQPTSNRILPIHSGTILHNTLDELMQHSRGQKISALPLSEYTHIIHKHFLMSKENLQSHPLLQTATNQMLFDKMEDVLKRSFTHMYEGDQYTAFVPQEFEKQLTEKIVVDGKEILITGKIDRIDIDTHQEYFRIVDYKSSNKKLDFNELLHGTQLQLPFYSHLLSQQLKQKLAGSMYVPLVNPIINLQNKDDIEKKDLKEYQATGFFLENLESLTLFDDKIASDGFSDLIAFKAKKDGTPDSHSLTLTAEEIDSMQQFALDKTKTAIKQISEKDFRVRPQRIAYDQKEIACRFCAFRSICQFDQKINHFNEKPNSVLGESFKQKKDSFFHIVKGGKK